jgi:hypothetical protein
VQRRHIGLFPELPPPAQVHRPTAQHPPVESVAIVSDEERALHAKRERNEQAIREHQQKAVAKHYAETRQQLVRQHGEDYVAKQEAKIAGKSA